MRLGLRPRNHDSIPCSGAPCNESRHHGAIARISAHIIARMRHNVGSSGQRGGAPKLAVKAPHGSAAPLITSTCTADSTCDFRQRSLRTHLTGKERAHLTWSADRGPCRWDARLRAGVLRQRSGRGRRIAMAGEAAGCLGNCCGWSL